MKFTFLKWFPIGVILLLISLAMFSFTTNSQYEYEPVLMLREDMEAAVELKAPREIDNPGKIWVYNQYVFVIEQYKGIHVLDNADSKNPQNVGFIQVDGCTDVAVRNAIIYANNAVDLIGLKASEDYSSIDVVSRNRNVLPELISPEGWNPWIFEQHRPANSVIVRWETYNAD